MNPIETEGVYPLPEAQVDRFMIKSTMDYLSDKEEIEILRMKTSPEIRVGSVLDEDIITQMKRDVRKVYIHESILSYVNDISRATRSIDDLDLGLSPRGAIHLLLAAQGKAYLTRRNYVIPDDVKAMAHKVMDHRLILSPEADMEGLTRGGITDTVLSTVAVPKGEFTKKAKE